MYKKKIVEVFVLLMAQSVNGDTKHGNERQSNSSFKLKKMELVKRLLNP